MEGYAKFFRKQVFTPKVVQEAVKITHTQSKKVGRYIIVGDSTAHIRVSYCRNMDLISPTS